LVTALEHNQQRSSGGGSSCSSISGHLQDMQQLTHLSLGCGFPSNDWPSPSAAAYSASTKVQHLDIKDWLVPVGAWQQMFPSGRQLPHLEVLAVGYICSGTVSEGSRLVSCCPRLRSLRVQSAGDTGSTAKLFGPLTGLSDLRELGIGHICGSSPEGLELLFQLTRAYTVDMS
jgi:hypothetical protein